MPRVFFQHRKTKARFEVTAIDKEAGEITLKGEYATFTEKFSPARFKELGYERVIEEDDKDAVKPRIQA